MTPAEFRALRLRCGLSLRQMSRVLHCHWTTLWRGEMGRHAIPPQRAVLVATMAMYAARHTPRPCRLCHGTGVAPPEG
jgi:DNA-binding transcriptional regulator YiaG